MPARRKGKYDLNVSLSHGTARQNKRQGLKIQQKKARKEGEKVERTIKRIGYAEKAAKAAIAVDTVVGTVTAAGLARKAAKHVAKKAGQVLVNKGSKFGTRTTASKTKQARKTLDANKKKATPPKKPQRKNADPYDDPNYLLDREMTGPPGKWSRARHSQVKKSKKKSDRKDRAELEREKRAGSPGGVDPRDHPSRLERGIGHRNDGKKLGTKQQNRDFVDPTTKGGKNRTNKKKKK